jgi:hypothetical protein
LGANPMYYMDNEGSARAGGSFGLVPSGFFYQNMLTISRMHEDYTMKTVNEKEHRAYPEVSEGYVRAVGHLSRGPYTVFARMLLPAVGKAAMKTAHQQFFLDATDVGCAIERYRLAKGGLPPAVQDLVPSHINAIPKDIINGQPLKYKTMAKADTFYIRWDGMGRMKAVRWSG